MSQNAVTDPRMQRFFMAEAQKVRFNKAVNEVTEMCFDKCVDYPGRKMDNKTSYCLTNCVERFLDTSNFISNRTIASASSSSRKTSFKDGDEDDF